MLLCIGYQYGQNGLPKIALISFIKSLVIKLRLPNSLPLSLPEKKLFLNMPLVRTEMLTKIYFKEKVAQFFFT